MSDEIIKLPTTSDNSLGPESFGTKSRVKLNGSCSDQDKSTFNHGKIVNTYIVYELSSNLNYFDSTLKNCLLGAVKLTKNADNILDMVMVG